MGWDEAISEWATSLRAAGRPESTVNLRLYQIGRLRRHVAPLGPWDVRGDVLVRWLGGAPWGTSTKRSYRSAARGFYAWAHRARLIEDNPALDLMSIKPKRAEPRPVPMIAFYEAMASADDRLRLMLRLACDCGMRRAEVAQVHSRDLERDLTGWTLRVLGKGQRVRRIPLPDDLARELVDHGPGFLFPGDVDGHLSARWVGKLVSRSLPAAWTMHTLRHRFATDAYAVDTDVFMVQELLGHSSADVTRDYVQLPLDGQRRTVTAVAAARRAAGRAA